MERNNVEYWREQHALNMTYLREVERIRREREDAFIAEFGRAPKGETFKHHME